MFLKVLRPCPVSGPLSASPAFFFDQNENRNMGNYCYLQTLYVPLSYLPTESIHKSYDDKTGRSDCHEPAKYWFLQALSVESDC